MSTTDIIGVSKDSRLVLETASLGWQLLYDAGGVGFALPPSIYGIGYSVVAFVFSWTPDEGAKPLVVQRLGVSTREKGCFMFCTYTSPCWLVRRKFRSFVSAPYRATCPILTLAMWSLTIPHMYRPILVWPVTAIVPFVFKSVLRLFSSLATILTLCLG